MSSRHPHSPRRPPLRRLAVGAGVLAVTLALVSAVGLVRAPAAGKDRLIVFVPCGPIVPVMKALTAFRADHPGVEVISVMDKAGPLRRRVEAGEACDVFIAWGDQERKPVEAAGLVVPGSARRVARAILTLAVPQGNPGGVKKLSDLTRASVRTVAVGPPKSHPGLYTRQALQRAGLTKVLAAKLFYPKQADELAPLVGRGEVDAAVLFRSCIQSGVDRRGRPIIARMVQRVQDIPQNLHDPINLTALVLRRSRQPSLAAEFIGYLSRPQVQRAFREAGFRTASTQ